MKILHKILLGATLCAVCACSQKELFYGEDGTDTGDAGIGSGNTRELLLEFDNTLQLAPGTQTRAGGEPIASDAENQIVSMDIYLFGSTEEEGEYTFMEHLAYRSNQEVVEGATPFELYPNAQNSAAYNAILNVTKGLYVKLYCVANQTDLFMLEPATGGDMYPDATFSKLTLDTESGLGEITAAGTPTEADFQSKYLLRVLTPQTTVLDVPLPMVGNVPGPIDLTNLVENSRLHTNLKLTRAVARFDVVNTAAQSGLTINSIGMEGGNATTTMFPMVPQPGADGEQIDYPQRSFADDDEINTGGRLSAYYSYAAPKEACLVLNGTYKTPAQEVINVSYKVPFTHIVDDEGVSVAIQPNHRYTVTVNEADAYEVKLTITVADWEEGGNIDDYDPSGGNALKLISTGISGDVTGNVVTAHLHTITTTNGTKGSITFQSNSEVTPKIAYAGGDTDHQWLSFAAPTVTALTGNNEFSHQYVFVPTVAQNSDYCYPPATVTFTNAAGSQLVLTLHSQQLWSSASANQAVTILNNSSKQYLVVMTDLANGTTTWNTAMTKCPADEGWRLPSMNDVRQLIKMAGWDTTPYLSPGSTEYTDAFNSKTYAYDGTPEGLQYGHNGAFTNGYGFYHDSNAGYYWTSDTNPQNTAQAGYVHPYSSGNSATFGFVAKTNSGTYRVRCIKDWN